MSWTDVRDAVQAAVVTASGLPATSVRWKFQDTDEPPLDYVMLHFSNFVEVGQDFVQWAYVGGPAGSDVAETVYGTREVTLEIECFSQSTADANDASARAELIKSSLRLPSVRSGLAAVNLAPFDPGPVQYAPDVPDVGFRGRATCSIRCYVSAQTVQDLISYFATINGTLTSSGGAQPGTTNTPFHAP